jgi:WD40 repeat protein
MRHLLALFAIGTLPFLPSFTPRAFATSDLPRLVMPAAHGEAVYHLVATPDGRWVISGTTKGQLKLWDATSGTEVRTISVGKIGDENLVALRVRNNTQIYVVCTRHVHILEVPSLKTLNSIESRHDLANAVVSADGESLWLGSSHGANLYVFQLRRGRFPLRQIMQRPRTPNTIPGWGVPDISPDGRYALVREAYDAPTVLVRFETGETVYTLPAAEKRGPRNESEFSINWSGDSRIVYSQIRGADGTRNQIDFINPDTRQVEWTTELAVAKNAIYWPKRGTPGQPQVLSNLKKILFIEGNKVDGPYDFSGNYYVSTASFAGDSRHLFCATTEGDVLKTQTYQLRKFDRARGSFSEPWSPPAYQTTLIAGSPLGDTLLVSDRREDAKLIQLGRGGIHITHIPVSRLFDATFAPDGTHAFYFHGDHDNRTSATLDVANPSRPRIARLPFESMSRGSFGNIVLSPSGKLAVDIRTGSTPVTVFDPSTGRVVRNFPNGHYSYDLTSGSAAFSADDRSLVYFTSEKTENGSRSVHCYDLESGQKRWTRNNLSHPFATFRFSPDGNEIYAVGIHSSPKLFVFNAATGETVREVILPDNDQSAQAIFNPGGTEIAFPSAKEILFASVADGREIRRLSHDSQTAEHLTYLGENRIASAGSDNAIRLWDIPSNTLLGTLSFSRDGTQWAFVHPSGRFEATDGFQEQMYFMQGAAKVPLSAYSEAYHTPGLIGQLMAGETIAAPMIELKDLTEPPKVTLELAGTRNLTVEDAPQEVTTEQATLRISAQSADSKVAEIRLYHNGKLVESRTRNLTVEDDTTDVDLGKGGKREDITVILLPGENAFRAVALNAQRTESKPAQLILDYKPTASAAAASTGRTGGGLQLHLLVVGINTYKNPKYNLNYAVPDATAVRDLVERASTGIFSKINVTTLFNEKATRAALTEAFASIAQAAGPRDVFVFYYAGHGVMSGDARPEFFLAPYELTQLYGADEQLRTKAISSAELLAFSQKIPAQKQLFLLDACQSAGALTTVAMRGAAEEKAVAQLARASGTHWITASGSEQFASEFEKLGHGTFTYALLEALAGKADNGDGRVTVNELKAFLETQVPELTKLHKGTPQYPASYGFGQDFPLAVTSQR